MGARFWADDLVYDDQWTVHDRYAADVNRSPLDEGGTPMGPNCPHCWHALVDGSCFRCDIGCSRCHGRLDAEFYCFSCGAVSLPPRQEGSHEDGHGDQHAA